MKGGHKVAHKTTTRKVHFATLFQKYEYIPVNVRKSNLKCGNFFVLHELVHRRRFLGFRTHVVVTTVCETGGVHTLCCRMHIFCTALRTSAHLHACEHTHGPRLWKRFCCMRMSLISVSPSPFSCFTLHPCCSPTVTSTTPSRLWRPRLPCRALPDPKARVKRTSAWVPRSLATWPIPTHSTGYMSPSSPTRPLLWTVTRCPSTIRTTIASLTSREPHARTLDCSVFPQCVKPLSRTAHGNFVLRREKPRNHASGNRCKTEKERKEKDLWSVLQSRCQGRVAVPGVVLFRLENSMLMNEISENTLNELNKVFLVKIQLRENYTRLSATWRSKIWSKKPQNVHWLTTRAWISKTTIIGIQSMGRWSSENTLV